MLDSYIWCFFSLMVDVQFVVGDECMRLVMVDCVSVDKDLKDRKW
jgi:hypothetical protein